MAEQDFPALVPEENNSPLATKKGGVRWKVSLDSQYLLLTLEKLYVLYL